MRGEELKQILETMDTNGDGMASASELLLYFRNNKNPNINKEFILQYLSRYDLNHDARIDLNELTQAYAHHNLSSS
ncbi:unnamed protein product [Calicophoron daubneyi]|uniref:EF-hand domain-containing protein n=1 Tax=Calicophoron daubneyi TaxID=300641 RepID=A0AAV2TW54_CALDB